MIKDQFLLDPAVTYLNFGSFGACPKIVFDAYQKFQLELERQPVQFMMHTGMKHLNDAQGSLAAYIGCDSNDVVLVTNPSYAINTIAKALPLNKGDEILTTNLEYGAMERTWRYYCDKAGAKYVVQQVTFPIQSKEQFLSDFWDGCTAQTKVVFISHITSATGLILPIEEICSEARRRGLLTIIDGAHVPGQLPLDLKALDADVYVGACHKWMMGPKGASFLFVKREQQHWVDPLLISWGFKSEAPSESTFIDYHQTAGTRDFSAFLAVPFCIEFMKKNNWELVRSHCQKKTIEWANRFKAEFGFQSIAPITDSFIGQMYSMPIKIEDPDLLKATLYDQYQIEVPVFKNHNEVFIRFSYQAFNTDEDMQYLFDTLRFLKSKGVFEFGG